METILEQLDVTSTAVSSLLEFSLVLNDESLALGVQGLGEGSRDGMMGSLGLGNKSLVALDGREVRRLFNRPLSYVAPGFTADGGLLGSL